MDRGISNRIKFLAYEVWKYGEAAENAYMYELEELNVEEQLLFKEYYNWFCEGEF